MMKPEYAACVAAILLKGTAPQSDPDDQNGTADQFIRICDPKTQTVVHSCWYASRFTRGADRMRFFLHKPRNYSVTRGAGRLGYIQVEAERADPSNPDETWWMQV
jgi:hypothetical protein